MKVVIFIGLEGVDEQPFFPIRTQTRINLKRAAEFRPGGKEVHHLDGSLLELRQVARLVRGYESNIQVRSVIEFATAELAEADDHEWRGFLAARRDFQCILQARFRQ